MTPEVGVAIVVGAIAWRASRHVHAELLDDSPRGR